MFELAAMSTDSSVQLPEEIARHLAPSDRFIAWMEGDTVHLKRIAPSPLSKVESAPQDTPMSLEEINDLVHRARQQGPARNIEQVDRADCH